MIELKSPEARLIYTFDWADAIPIAATLVSVVHSVPDPLIIVNEAFDVGQQLSNVEIDGGVHGGIYQCKGIATLSTGENVPDSFTLRVFAGA